MGAFKQPKLSKPSSAVTAPSVTRKEGPMLPQACLSRRKEPMKHPSFAYYLALILLLTPCAQAENAETAPASSPEITVVTLASLEEEADGGVYRTVKEANLRSRPGRNEARINTLIKGKKVKLLEEVMQEDDLWAHVRVVQTGQEGYVLMTLLEKVPDPTPTPEETATPEPTPTPTATPAPTPGGTIEETFDEPLLVRTTMRTNLRSQPDGDRLDALETGTHLSVTGQVEDETGRLWYHVREKSGREGYMLAELLHQIRPAQPAAISEAEIRTLFPVVACDPLEDMREADLPAYSEETLSAYGTLDVGTRSSAVLRLKRRLYEMGYYAKPNENYNYTESTADVIRIFQEDVGLPATGIADPLTQAALFDEHTAKREGSPQELAYLDIDEAELVIQTVEVTNYNFHGSLQLSLRNNSGERLTAFGLRVIPYMRDGSAADMAETFAEEIERDYAVYDISIDDGSSYSDFYTNGKFDDGIWPHHFEVSNQIYFSGAQLAVSWYRSGGRNVYVDDDQLVFVEAGCGAGDAYMNTLPIALTAEEKANSAWEMGVVTRYVLPVYQAHYGLPQGAWVKSVETNSPAYDAGLQAGDVIVGIGETTILGDATLRQARGRIDAGESAVLYFWRDGQYYQTDIARPAAD